MEEKKEIKMSLFSFYVLVAGVVFLIGGILIAGMSIIQINNAEINKGNNLAGYTNNATVNTNMPNTNKETANQTTQTNANTSNVQNGNASSGILNHITVTEQNNVITNNSNSTGETTSSYPGTGTTPKEQAEKRLLLSDKSELNIDKLDCIIDTTKKVENVSNYASTMKWSKYTMEDLTFEYPTDWKVEKINDGVEEVRISGTAVGKIASKTEVGENGDQVLACDMEMIVYKPIECTQLEKDSLFAGEFLSGFDARPEGLQWTQLYNEGKYLYSTDNYSFYQDANGIWKLIRTRILYPISEHNTYKTINIENAFVGEFRLRK